MIPEPQEPLSTLPTSELIRRARDGQRDALEELLRRYQAVLRKWARGVIKSDAPGGARPSDVAQDASLAAFRHFLSFKGASQSEWTSWLRKVVTSKAKMSLRRAQGAERNSSGNVPLYSLDETQEVASPRKSPSQVTAHREEWRRLLVHFHGLPADQQEALTLRRLKELSAAEVAERMHRSEAAVDSLVQRATRTLRDRLVGVEAKAVTPEARRIRNMADAVLAEYLRRRESGERVTLEEVIREHPDCAEELRGLLHGMEQLKVLWPGDPA
ncbi:sigma-70 family RNA polymerase sigma factor [Corallococcus carmarthensis]|uniref:Sigma-70 family RNA polymerase sigma factor n=1 Tax=Corallococcus carmarthensis TaxID=2316728 RepID=A0A3A8KCM7_9BACT|nr:sigma-70 family RNA polymerase sigma factor [Corallococcus carmarthensis]RKH02095.1 sigma-70 family RNA polymerase sigma factor [Corallococcus carmarthensis]